MLRQYDVAVIGAGSGGIGAALAAAREGLAVCLVEKAPVIGGTATRAGVSVWEPGVGGTGIPLDIYRALRPIPQAVGIYTIGRHCLCPGPGEERYPGGEAVVDYTRSYVDSLLRHGARSMAEDEAFVREHWHGVGFEPDVYRAVVHALLDETGRCDVATDTGLADADMRDGRIAHLRLDGGNALQADVYVDATGDGLLAMACGCGEMMGQEGRDAFGEPGAPEEATDRVNGITLIYRITPTSQPSVEALPPDVPKDCWWRASFPGASVTQYPCGDWNVNVLPTMEGEEFLRLGPEAAYAECLRRSIAHWHHSQVNFPEFQRYRRSWIAPALGVRETRRIVCEKVLTQHDLLAGLSGQTDDDIVAIADHAMDTHGGHGHGCGELKQPYGIPYRCLLPKRTENLLIACRAAGFSSLAASSCRLSRTMMQLGQAAGTAAAIARDRKVSLREVPTDELRARLVGQGVELEWPRSTAMLKRISEA
ncbi:MAG TPA: FAD-dependent oxidoreductase [Armatimonadota bacterium]|nr:FAD-dependent oxidoreductase [Armatimonadota bacterium]